MGKRGRAVGTGRYGERILFALSPELKEVIRKKATAEKSTLSEIVRLSLEKLFLVNKNNESH